MVADAPAKAKRVATYACGRCGGMGHNARGCSGAPKILHRCLAAGCAALVWDRERAMHIYDRHGRAVTAEALVGWFEVAIVPVFDEGGDT